jgi:gliding-associated putative ABC transporter substrate-binding component GldG
MAGRRSSPRFRKELVLTALTLLVVLLIGLNGSRFFTRIDLTENNIYTISDVSKNLFREIEGKVRISYYVSDKLRQVTTVPETIEDLLREYSAYGRGKIHLRTVDPSGQEVQQKIEELGIYPRQIEVVEDNQKTYAEIYSGILVQYRDRNEVIPLALRLETLEYDLTSAIRRVLDPGEKQIAVLVSHPERTVENSYSLFRRHLSRRYRISPFGGNEAIPEGSDLLVVFGAAGMETETVRRIDEYVARGGRVLFAVEGVDVNVFGSLEAEKLDESNPLLDLLSEYGVRVERSLLLDAFARRFRIPRSSSLGTSWEILDPYPHWMRIRSSGAAVSHPISARFGGLDLLWASPLEYEESEELRIERLLSSSTRSWIMDSPFRTNPYRSSSFYPEGAGRGAESGDRAAGEFGGGPFDVALALEGRVDHPYAETAADEKSRMVVIGDSDFASDFIRYSDSMYNLDFTENCIDWLALNEDMMQIRTRNVRHQGLDRMPRDRAELQYGFSRFINLVLVPLLIVGFGLVRRFIRRRRSS